MKKIDVTPRVWLAFLLLILIIASAFWLRRYTFWLPHWKGDQSHYVTLAMKLEHFGFDGYNLRESKIRFVEPSKEPPIVLVFAEPGSPGVESDLLKILKIVGQSYYDEPLHMRAPLFPWTLMWAHKLLAEPDQPYILCSSNLGESVKIIRPDIIYRTQQWAVKPALFFNLALILMTFLLGAYFFGARTGFYSAVLMATNPVSLMLAHRLLADDLLVLLTTLSFFGFHYFYGKKSWNGIAAAGALAGLAFLTKQTAAFIFPAIWIFTVLDHPDKRWTPMACVRKAVNMPAVLFGISMLAVSAFWFVKVWQVYGNPLHKPDWGLMLQSIQSDTSGWAVALYRRPHPVFLFSLGILYLSPMMGLAYGTLAELRRQTNAIVRGAIADSRVLFLWLWILAFFIHFLAPWNLLNFNGNREHRYFYLAYPAFFVLASYILDRMRDRLGKAVKNSLAAEALAIVLIVLNGFWGVSIAMKYIFENDMLL